MEDSKLIELFDELEKTPKLSIVKRLKLRYNILRLHNILQHRNRINRRLECVCNIVRKDLE